MNTPWKNRSSKPQLRPSRRAVRPLVEGLETRVVQTVNASITAGHLLITGDSAGNTITLDHSGTTTLVNGKAFADSAITDGIEIRAGHNTFLEADTINILAMNDATTVDGEGGQIDVNVGKSGLVQGVAPLTIQNLGFGGFGSHLSVDNSADPVRRTVTIDGDDSFGSLSGTGGSQIKFSTFALTETNYFGGGAGNTYNVKPHFPEREPPVGRPFHLEPLHRPRRGHRQRADDAEGCHPEHPRPGRVRPGLPGPGGQCPGDRGPRERR